MQQYTSTAQAERLIQSYGSLPYPNYEQNFTTYLSDVQFGSVPSGGYHVQPSDLFVESLHHIGREPKHILDIGAQIGRHSLLLAEMGHIVTAIDSDAEALDEARENARRLGIPHANFKPVCKDVRHLTADDKFEVVMGIMVAHFLEQAAAAKMIRVMQAATVRSGLSIIDAYTTNNPAEEINHRNIRYLFQPGELGRLCVQRGWSAHRNVEGLSRKPMNRSHIAGAGMVLVPTVAEVIMRKSAVSPRTFMNANREVVEY